MRDMVELHINGKKWRHFSDFELTLGLDSCSACGFRAPFDYERAEVREAFRPTAYHPVDVRIDGIQVFGGRMYEVTPEVSASGSEVTVTAYAHPFQLTKSCAPADPSQHRHRTLPEAGDRSRTDRRQDVPAGQHTRRTARHHGRRPSGARGSAAQRGR